MKNLFKVSLLSIMLFIGANLSAQDTPFSFGLKAGVNLSNIGGDLGDDMDSKIGYNVGVTVDYAFTENWYLLTGLELTAKGAEFDKAGYKLDLNPLFLQLPIHAAYKFPIGENLKIVVNAGPYVAYGLGGKFKIDDDGDKEEYEFFGREKKGIWNRFDFGIGLGGGPEISKFKVGIGYDFGLTNIANNGKIKTKNGYLTVGYRF